MYKPLRERQRIVCKRIPVCLARARGRRKKRGEREKRTKKNNFAGLISNVDILYRFSYII